MRRVGDAQYLKRLRILNTRAAAGDERQITFEVDVVASNIIEPTELSRVRWVRDVESNEPDRIRIRVLLEACTD